MVKPIQRLLQIVKAFQYLLHAIDFVNVFPKDGRARHAVFFPGGHEPRSGQESI